jgi:transcriptional regulator with XRE-family HTH domain
VSLEIPFAELLAELRTARGLSQEALAGRAAVSVRAVGDLERGVTRRPHRDTVRALATALALTTAERDGFERTALRAPLRPPRRDLTASGLPAQPHPLLGRDADLVAVGRLVRRPGVRLITVTGPAGVGKTRLAGEVARRVAGSFDRVDALGLLPLRGAAGLRAALQPAAHEAGGGRRLVLLDGADHIPDAAPALADLLTGCAGLTLLVTGRAPVRLRGEHLWPLAPRPVPPEGAPPGTVRANPAAALLLDRAAASRPGFALTAANAEPIAALCRRLAGYPLAIELAAAHLRTREVADLAAALPVVPEPVPAVVAWALHQLGEPDLALLRAVAGRPDGATRERLRAALADAGADPARVDAAVAALAALHLVTATDAAGQARIGMHEAIRAALPGRPPGHPAGRGRTG